MQVLICHPSLKEARGVRVKVLFLFLFAIICSPHTSLASNKNSSNLEDSFCTYGSHKQLYKFFAEKDYIVIAQGKRLQPNSDIKDFADVLFLVSPDMEYFHAVTLSGIKHDHFKACIFSSAREIDYQFSSPIPDLLTRKNREHVVLLADDIPKNTSCPNSDKYCTPWTNWSHTLKQTLLLSAYTYSTKWRNDSFKEIVELTLDNKVIRPTRGKLTEHARKKYALRLRNELNESKEDLKNTKIAYKQIHDEVDHKLPLIFLSLTETRDWSLSEVNREEGLVKTVLHGVKLELYPMPNNAYKEFLDDLSP
jgi:hypothetical protein